MSVYVCSDIHGRYDRYIKLLDTIKLGSSDKLYILGDIIDRGTDGIEIIQDIMKRDNIELLLGNHEYLMLNSLFSELSGNLNTSSSNNNLDVWLNDRNGGYETLKKYLNLSYEEQIKIFQFLFSIPVIKVIEVNNRKIHLSHSYTIKHLKKDTYGINDISLKELNDVVWKSPFRYDNLFVSSNNYRKDLTYIVGHVPVQTISGYPWIFKEGNIINVDCGCAFGTKFKNYLGCLRLNDMKEFYIE